jgi:hypothetical protein
MVYEYNTPNGTDTKPLCNFNAQIVEQITADDGVEQRITLALEGQLANGSSLPRVEISATEFGGMNWVVPSWGTKTVVSAGMGARDHLRAAIQLMSADVAQRYVFEHTGWRQVGDEWLYLHAGGAIGAGGLVADVQVSLPGSLGLFELPESPDGDELVECVRASLHILKTGPPRITASMMGAALRAVLGPADFTVHVAGATGFGKTELPALAQQHFGAGMDARNLPGSWSSTANSLEGQAFHLKDALLVVDDFAPHGSISEIARQHKEADRLLRAQGNRSGRGRCRSDGSLRPPKPPRGLMLSTGEDIPRGESLRSRLWVLELSKNDVNWDRLTASQADARDGKLAACLSGYLKWLAPRIAGIQQKLRQRTAQLRQNVQAANQHARTPGIVADLLLAWQIFLQFVGAAHAMGKPGRDVLLAEIKKAILENAGRQADLVKTSEPSGHFLRLLTGALASGRAHVADCDGNEPTPPQPWGWRLKTIGAGAYERSEWQPQGRRIGWTDGEHLFLDPEAAYAAGQELARDHGDSLTVSQRTLAKRLHEKHVLIATEKDRLTTRRTLEGTTRHVWQLPADCLQA